MNNRFLHFILAAVLLTAVIPMAAQTLIALGTGTDYNGPTIDPTPYGTYYKNFRQQYLYKASEIIAQGGTFGTITRLGFNIQAMNNCSEVPHYIIRIKHTSQNVLNTTFEIGEYTEVWHETFYVPTTTGWQNHTLTTPFVWDGTSNLLIDIVTTMAATATQNVSVYYTTAQLIPDYRSLRFQSNTLPAGSATTGILSHDYANLRMVIYSPILPANLVAPALGADAFCNVELTWSPGEGATPTGYRLYLGTDGGGTETPTNLVNGQDLGNVTTYSHPSFLENNTTLYWKIVPYVLGDEAEQCPIWNFNTSPLFGTFIIGPEGDFSNFTNAILFLNHSGVTAAGATFKVANQNFHEVLPPITASGTQTGRIIFEPLNETDNPKLALFSFPEATYGFKLEGADYVTINNIDLDGAGSMLYGYWLTDGATHCIIQNCAINVQFHTGPINYSIYSYGANSYSNFLNNVIYGDPFVAIAVTGLYGNRSISNQISDNLIDSGAAYGISIEYTDSTTIANNRIISSVDNNNTFKGIKKSIGSAAQIYGNHISGSTSSTMYGIFLEMGDCHVYQNMLTNLYSTGSGGAYGLMCFGTDTEIHDNLFRNISYTGTNPYQAMGIEVYLGGYNKIYNNMISKISNPNSTMTPQVIAINIDTSFPNDIINNSIFLNAEGPLSNPNFITAGVNFARDFNITMTNNIIVNLSNSLGGGLSCALYSYNCLLSGLAAGTDNNIYYCGTPDATHMIASFQGIEYQTIDDYKNATGTIEQNSLTELVPFVSIGSLPDLHIRTYMPTVVEGNGTPIAWVTEDFDGNSRHATNPDIGADEGNFLTTTPDTPQNVLIDGSDGVFTIYWDLVQGATIYKIYRAVDPYASLPWQLIGTVQNPNHYHVFEDYDPKAFYFVTAQY